MGIISLDSSWVQIVIEFNVSAWRKCNGGFKFLDFIENGANSMLKDEKRIPIDLRVIILHKNSNPHEGSI